MLWANVIFLAAIPVLYVFVNTSKTRITFDGAISALWFLIAADCAYNAQYLAAAVLVAAICIFNYIVWRTE